MTKPLIIATPILAAAFGYLAGLQPTGEWRWFSWHPFLMVLGFVGFMGSGSMIKKMGGYTNTKVHGILGSLGTMCALGGFYVIYSNKNELGKDHFTTPHGKAGLLCLIGSIMVGSAGGVFLHPDFGADKTNKTIRKIHSWASRFVIGLGWLACFSGLRTIAANDPKMLVGYVIPMLCLVPQVLVPGMTKVK